MRKGKKENRQRKVDKLWEKIFQDRPILKQIKEDGSFQISSSEINEYKGAEARLLTKFDYWDILPYILQQNNLNILFLNLILIILWKLILI